MLDYFLSKIKASSKTIKSTLDDVEDERFSNINKPEEMVLQYPPVQNGIPTKDIQFIADSQKDLIYKIKNLTQEEDWEYYKNVISNFIKYCHLVPASESHHHRGIGGLVRHGLEVAYYSIYSSEDNVAGSNLLPEDRRNFIKKWKFAIFCAGICHDIGKPITDMTISSNDGNIIWNPYESDLYTWLISNNIQNYNLVWRVGREGQHSILGSVISYQIIGKKAMGWVSKGNDNLVYDMTEAILAYEGRNNLIRDIVRNADQLSVQKDLKNMATKNFGDIGIPVERFILDAIRRIAQKSKVNDKNSTFWIINSDLYLTWPKLCYSVFEILNKDGIPGIPKDPDTIADILIDRGIAIATEDKSHRIRYWSLSNCQEMGIGVKTKSIKLKNTSLIYDVEPDSVFGHCLPFKTKSNIQSEEEINNNKQVKVSENIKQVPVTQQETPEEEADDKYDIFIDKLPEASKIIMKIMNTKYKSKIKSLSFIDSNQRLNLNYPQGLEGLGMSATVILRSLNDSNLLAQSSASGVKLTKKIVDVDSGIEKNVIIFDQVATDYIINYVDPEVDYQNEIKEEEKIDVKTDKVKIENNTDSENEIKKAEINNIENKTKKNEQDKKTEISNTVNNKIKIDTSLKENETKKEDTQNNKIIEEENNNGKNSKNNDLIDYAENNESYKKVIYAIIDLFTEIRKEKADLMTRKISASEVKFAKSKISNTNIISVEVNLAVLYVSKKTSLNRAEVEAKINKLISEKKIISGTLTINEEKIAGIGIKLDQI